MFAHFFYVFCGQSAPVFGGVRSSFISVEKALNEKSVLASCQSPNYPFLGDFYFSDVVFRANFVLKMDDSKKHWCRPGLAFSGLGAVLILLIMRMHAI